MSFGEWQQTSGLVWLHWMTERCYFAGHFHNVEVAGPFDYTRTLISTSSSKSVGMNTGFTSLPFRWCVSTPDVRKLWRKVNCVRHRWQKWNMSALTLHDRSAFFGSFWANWASFAFVFSVHGCFYRIQELSSLMAAPIHELYTSAPSIKSLQWIFQITWVVFKISVPVFSRMSYSGQAFVLTGFFHPILNYNTSGHKLKSPVSMNYSVALALKSNASFIQPSNLWPTHLAQKKYLSLSGFFILFYFQKKKKKNVTVFPPQPPLMALY